MSIQQSASLTSHSLIYLYRFYSIYYTTTDVNVCILVGTFVITLSKDENENYDTWLPGQQLTAHLSLVEKGGWQRCSANVTMETGLLSFH